MGPAEEREPVTRGAAVSVMLRLMLMTQTSGRGSSTRASSSTTARATSLVLYRRPEPDCRLASCAILETLFAVCTDPLIDLPFVPHEAYVGMGADGDTRLDNVMRREAILLKAHVRTVVGSSTDCQGQFVEIMARLGVPLDDPSLAEQMLASMSFLKGNRGMASDLASEASDGLHCSCRFWSR